MLCIHVVYIYIVVPTVADLGDLGEDTGICSGVQLVDLPGVRVHIVEEGRVVSMETKVFPTNFVWEGLRTEATGRGREGVSE